VRHVQNVSRRSALQAGALAAAAASLGGPATAWSSPPPADPAPADGNAPWGGLKVGVATYSLRKLPADAAIRAVQRVGLTYVSIKDVHLPLTGTADERRAGARRFREAGLVPLSCGTITMRTEADARAAFEYARDVGVPTIVCNPDASVLPALDRLVREYDVRAAIHNHGPNHLWNSPYDVWARVQTLDPRVGLCIDVGHTLRAGVDPAAAVRRCRMRLYDLHLKDNDRPGPDSGNAVLGRGVLDVRALFRALREVRYAHLVGFEFEMEPDDPLPGLAESVGYARAVADEVTRARA